MPSSQKKTTKPTKVVIKNDISIEIPEGMIYSTENDDINVVYNIFAQPHLPRSLVFLKEEKNQYYYDHLEEEEQEFNLSMPYGSPQSFVLFESNTLPESVKNVIRQGGFNETARIIATNSIKELEKDYVVVKEEKDIFVYYIAPFDENALFFIITPEYFHSGQIYINDTEERNIIYQEWLSKVEKSSGTEVKN